MTGTDLVAVRERLGLNDVQMGIKLGYQGSGNTIHQTMRRYESGEREIPHWIAVTARALDVGSISDAINAAVGELLDFDETNDVARAVAKYLAGESDGPAVKDRHG